MTIISKANKLVSSVLKSIQQTGDSTRLSRYTIIVANDEEVLVYNTLTEELIFLAAAEYSKLIQNEYLKSQLFIVSDDCKEKEYADLVKWALKIRQKKAKSITGYTIFPTTDCNARCFYCFELGRSRVPMSKETAEKTAYYIKNHCGGEKVKLSWFGGEPLYNREAIETICRILKEEKVEFTSSAVSNGYLFDEETVETAVRDWNLKNVQITLDGTEETYNKVKAFVYKGVNPYRTVMENIGHLLDAGVKIQIRLNMDLYNAEDLMKLVEELAERFGGRKGIHVYAHHIFKGNEAMADSHTEEEWAVRTQAMIRLEDKIRECGLESKAGISKHIKLNQCMADSGKAVTILPDGHIGLCEHFSENEFIGHVDQEGFDEAVVKSWKERMPELPECGECVLYPECIQLKKCPNGGKCFPALREERIRKIKRRMLNEYERWKSQQTSEETDEDELC
jgi:radical SAM protein with 4Fe4S-binding SPASM domain